MKAVRELLKSKIKNNDKVIVACSGGSDSMALLYLIMSNFNVNNIICAHINHKVRKKSDYEYAYLESFCNQNKIIFEGLEISTRIKKNFEAEARKIRYDFLEVLLKKYHAKYILTAHHGDDQMETILMRLTRGSTLSGYAGIKIEDGKYLRPLLNVQKEDILKYVKENNIKYFDDYTNKLNIHTRNKYRHLIIPFLKKENPLVYKKFLRFSNELLAYDDFVLRYIKEKNLIVDNKVSVTKLKLESELIQRKVIEQLIKNIQQNNLLEVSTKNVENILNIIKSSKSNNTINLSNGFVAKKSYDVFEIIKQIIKKDFEMCFESEYEDSLLKINKIEENNEKSNWILRLYSKEVKLPIKIRNRKEGDFIYLKNSGRKKIKDIFIDEKISKDVRDKYPLVVDSNDIILWIPGMKKSKFDKDKEEKYDIILSSERK